MASCLRPLRSTRPTPTDRKARRVVSASSSTRTETLRTRRRSISRTSERTYSTQDVSYAAARTTSLMQYTPATLTHRWQHRGPMNHERGEIGGGLWEMTRVKRWPHIQVGVACRWICFCMLLAGISRYGRVRHVVDSARFECIRSMPLLPIPCLRDQRVFCDGRISSLRVTCKHSLTARVLISRYGNLPSTARGLTGLI